MHGSLLDRCYRGAGAAFTAKGGLSSAPPSDAQGQDINWNIAANQAIQAWSP